MRKTIFALLIGCLSFFLTFPVYAFQPSYQFTDQERDGESGLYNFDAREYNPGIGRFVQPDPVLNNLTNPQALKQQTGQDIQELLKDPQNLNPYSYTRNNPIRYVDPTGQWFGEFFTGQQSWSSFQMELGEAAMYANSLMSTVIDHPYATGAILGLGSGALAAGITLAAGGSITCGILCGSTAAEVATAGGTAAATQGDKIVKQAIPLLNPPINITEKALTKISQAHQGVYDGFKSVFNEGENIIELIQKTTQSPMITQVGDKFARIVDVGRNIGIDRLTGKQTQMMTVITSAVNELITAYPGIPSYLSK